MSAKPGDFLIGIGELIGIVLPGAVVAYVATPALQRAALLYALPVPTDTAAWVAFAVIAYFAGHLVFLFGSFLDRPYDWIRQRLWPREKDQAYIAATAIRKQILGSHAEATNTYKFATAVLALDHETAYAEVRQLEADSKFFRSLVILALGLCVGSLSACNLWTALAFTAAGVLCYWRYVERRWKATQRAFQYVVVLDGIGRGFPPSKSLNPEAQESAPSSES